MPGTMTENEHLLSLLSVEVLISQVRIDLNMECHLPCVVFRLLDYPAVSIPYFDQWQIEEFHQLKQDYPKTTWRQLLSDQFYELRSANGKFNFNRGKSCLFKTYFKTLYTHLLNVPLFILLIDQIHDRGPNNQTTHFIGSGNVKLNELIEILNQSIIREGNDVPLVEQQTFHCNLFNLMGTPIGTCDLAVRFCHYGTTILSHLPMLDEGMVSRSEEKKAPPVSKETVAAPAVVAKPAPTTPPAPDSVVKHIHFVNEKRDVGLQLSRSDLPSESNQHKAAQTRWTSTKPRSSEYHRSKGRYLRTIEDPSLDDPSITSYQPPPLYFNAHSDFLQMTTPTSEKFIEEAKENRLSYLASIPIDSFHDQDDFYPSDEDQQPSKPPRKSKSGQSVRFNLGKSSPLTEGQGRRLQPLIKPKQQLLANDFLKNFPLLRSLVEEALALQHSQDNVSISLAQMVFDERPRSALPAGQRKSKTSPHRPQSAMTARTKSAIVPRRRNENVRRLYPPPPDPRQMVVTKTEVRNLVDRLSQPKYNRRVEREMAAAELKSALAAAAVTTTAEPNITPRLPPKVVPTPPSNINRSVIAQKPPPSYGTTRAHRLYTEFSRARRAAQESSTTATSPRSQKSPRKESPKNERILPSSPQLLNTGTLSHFSLLNKVDLDSATIDKNSMQQGSVEPKQENTLTNIQSSSTTSQDVTLELNRPSSDPSSTSSSPTPEPTRPEHDLLTNGRNELGFSITDVTDYFTDGGNGSSTRPSTRQSP